MVNLLLAATGTALATGLGAIPVILMGDRAETLRSLLLGLAAGVMIVAALLGLITPALSRGSVAQVLTGVLIGAVFLLVVRRVISEENPRHQQLDNRGTSILVFLVLFVHSFPEGFAVGTAYAEDPATIGLFVVLAIAIQNIPEGTSVAIPLAANGASASRQIGAAILSSAPQPIGAAIAFLLVESISSLLPVSFGFAAGAMLALAFVELIPQAVRLSVRLTVPGVVGGALTMVLVDRILQV